MKGEVVMVIIRLCNSDDGNDDMFRLFRIRKEGSKKINEDGRKEIKSKFIEKKRAYEQQRKIMRTKESWTEMMPFTRTGNKSSTCLG